MTVLNSHIMVLAGEPSGDVHGSDLVAAMKQCDPSLEFCGIGGPCLADAGVDLFFSIDHLSAMGLTEVIRQLGPIKKAFDLFRQQLRVVNPDLLILIDYPGFNLKAAKYARTHSKTKIFYYIPPKVWAWKKSRLVQIRQTVDHAGLIFPFEEKLYKKAGIPATYVGNPLMDRYPYLPARSFKTTSTASDPWIIGLLPGSRKNEIQNLLDLMLTAGEKIHRHHPHVRFLVSAADAIPLEMIEKKMGARQNSALFQVVPGFPRQIFDQADMLIAASGTITLEAALCRIPTVIVYKMSPFTFRVAKAVVKVKYAGLANIIVNKPVMPELLQTDATADNICHTALDMLDNLPEYRQKLFLVRQLLGSPGAAKRAAKTALDLIHQAKKSGNQTNRCLTNNNKPY
ncbi:MAG: lipid-A-disaccharide synthase [Desulfotignum sp.]|nr:lipid-A-disaccharide synthase [Desulfotignum sp.]